MTTKSAKPEGLADSGERYCLESEFAAKLENASGPRCNHMAIGSRVIRIVVDRRANCCRSRGIVSVLRVDENIERLRTELKAYSLGKLEVLAYSRIPIVDARSTDNIAPTVPELARKGLR